MAQRAAETWGPDTHHLFPGIFRRAVWTMLCVRRVLMVRKRDGGDPGMVPELSGDLPHDAWLEVLAYCGRGWFKQEEEEVDDDGGGGGGGGGGGHGGHGGDAEGGGQPREEPVAARQWCEWCFRSPTKLFKCSRCGVAKYCNAECARKGWASHKKFCKRAAKQRKEAESGGGRGGTYT